MSAAWTVAQVVTYRVRAAVGPDKDRQAALQSEHATLAEAFRALDGVSAAMVRTGTPSDAIELVVVIVSPLRCGSVSSSLLPHRLKVRLTT